MKSLLHIGMPKCMSTSLQTFLRGAKGVYFMGMGPSMHVDKDVLQIFQRQIVRTSSHLYDRNYVAQVFGICMAKARTANARLFVLSDETIPYPLSYGLVDVSYSERLRRLKEFMPEPTVVLMLVRRPADYLKSVYKYESVAHGLNFTYEEFLKRLLLKGDTYFLSTVKYSAFAREAQNVFGEVKVIAMEDIAADKRALSSFFASLGVPMPELPPRENVGIADSKFENFRNLLAPYGDGLSNNDFNFISPADRANSQANADYYGSVYASVLARDNTLGSLQSLAAQLPDCSPEAPFTMSDKTREYLTDYVAKSNASLKEQFGVDIEALDYGRF
jgi:hypothetical protein